MREELDTLWKIVASHDKKLKRNTWEEALKKVTRQNFRWQRQTSIYQGLHLALVVDTRDPWKQNRVRFFSPVLNVKPDLADTGRYTKVEELQWAWPISPFGGIDDSGVSWVPPAGSTVCIMFQHGNPNAAFYFGTTWQRDKGPENAQVWGYPVVEYDRIWKGHRKGYMVGKNDESQCLPPNNTSNYQGYDHDSNIDIGLVEDSVTKNTYPHEHTVKTPEKHRWTMDDGDPKCNRRGKRIEVQSSMGAYFLMKDDPYHPCGDWTNPNCTTSYVSIEPHVCIPEAPTVVSGISFWPAYNCDQGPEHCPVGAETASTTVEQEYLGLEHLCPSHTLLINTTSMPVDCSAALMNTWSDDCFRFNNTGRNKYHKHKQECFPFLQGRCGLPQSGVMLQARSGAGLTFDDSVEQPRERPEWERALTKFDMDGCTGVFKGRTFLRSATDHFIELNDQEVNPKVRGPKNGINIESAAGNYVRLNDHSLPGCLAGPNRGVHIGSTAGAKLDMCDDTNQQCSPERAGCSKTGAYARKAYVRLRNGSGVQLLMSDGNDQTRTDGQYLQLLSPQKDNGQRGPHMFHMQEQPQGPGQVFVRAGGDYIVYSYDTMVDVVGSAENPSDKLEFVSNMKVVSTKDVYYNKAKTHVFWADDYVFLLAGKDCATGGPGAEGTCVYPVVVAHQPIPEYISYMAGIKASEHVFASALPEPTDPCDVITSDNV